MLDHMLGNWPQLVTVPKPIDSRFQDQSVDTWHLASLKIQPVCGRVFKIANLLFKIRNGFGLKAHRIRGLGFRIGLGFRV